MEKAEQVVQLLKRKGCKLATAESCTGGMLAQYITSVSGASEVYEFGVISYSNKVKENELFVPEELLEKYGAVSEQVCIAMAEGMLKKSGADIAASITGIAGPDGGTPQKPVGTVFIALANKKGAVCKELGLAGDRRRIRENTVKNMLSFIKEGIDTL